MKIQNAYDIYRLAYTDVPFYYNPKTGVALPYDLEEVSEENGWVLIPYESMFYDQIDDMYIEQLGNQEVKQQLEELREVWRAGQLSGDLSYQARYHCILEDNDLYEDWVDFREETVKQLFNPVLKKWCEKNGINPELPPEFKDPKYRDNYEEEWCKRSDEDFSSFCAREDEKLKEQYPGF